MKTLDSTPVHGFLRQDEMNGLVATEKDPITASLMSRAAHILLLRVIRREKGPIADFDLQFFMEVIREFVSDHDALKKSLEGVESQEPWIADENSL